MLTRQLDQLELVSHELVSLCKCRDLLKEALTDSLVGTTRVLCTPMAFMGF